VRLRITSKNHRDVSILVDDFYDVDFGCESLRTIPDTDIAPADVIRRTSTNSVKIAWTAVAFAIGDTYDARIG